MERITFITLEIVLVFYVQSMLELVKGEGCKGEGSFSASSLRFLRTPTILLYWNARRRRIYLNRLIILRLVDYSRYALRIVDYF